MRFNSFGYIIIFLIVGTIIFWLLKPKYRVYFLGLGGISFYLFWKWEFVFLLFVTPVVDYWCASKIHLSTNNRKRKALLVTALVINIGLLLFFKYTYFIYDSINGVTTLFGVELTPLTVNIILPLGISFYTFHSISYTIDVFRGSSLPIKKFSTFWAYVAFWPQLMAGPILRSSEIIPQFNNLRNFQTERFVAGVERIIVGMFKKVVIAESIAGAVDVAFGMDYNQMTAFDVWVATFLFGFQIYFDFSGYSDIAIGSAKLLGIEFPENFNWPYFAKSPRDFWKKWHISLSAWIRDYLYLPLTGQKYKTKSEGGIAVAITDSTKKSTMAALFITWLIMGIWHGASWNFAFWGLYHASFIFLFRKIKIFDFIEKKASFIGWGVTLLIVMASWIFFRADGINQALVMYSKIIDPNQYVLYLQRLPAKYYYGALMMLVGMIVLNTLKVKLLVTEKKYFPALKFIAMSVMITLILVYLNNSSQFIYFQF